MPRAFKYLADEARPVVAERIADEIGNFTAQDDALDVLDIEAVVRRLVLGVLGLFVMAGDDHGPQALPLQIRP
ncbi:MAG: hypothetical protein KGJ84_10215 [Elusimicrobia bacterium]|nr:hypothetical protein [Elusimicrobiota bacterium]